MHGIRCPASPGRGLLRLNSSLRCRTPEDTFEIARGQMTALGISRVTDVTRMDRLGLPVFVSVRPRGLALHVHAGKGVRPEEARVGALMEAIEFAAAEPLRSAWHGRALRVQALEDGWAGAFAFDDLSPRLGACRTPGRLVHAVQCEDVAGGAPAWLPAELVFLPFHDPYGPSLFVASTNGLASGNTVAEATLHGLLEVLERDALAMNLPRDASRWIDPDDLPEPFASMASDWQRLGVSLAVRQVPNDFGLPAFNAMLHDEGNGQTVDLSAGSGLHLDPAIALARAVCEAAQSRLSQIHGGRDDVTRLYEHLADAPDAPDARDTLAYREAFDRARRIRWSDVPAVPADALSLDDLLQSLLERLRARGFPTVLRHRFDLPLGGLHVVKVVVPRCEEVEGDLSHLGPRLRRRVLAHG
jgi:ribosomal protein S12 methylthiotransferase accessory factor